MVVGRVSYVDSVGDCLVHHRSPHLVQGGIQMVEKWLLRVSVLMLWVCLLGLILYGCGIKFGVWLVVSSAIFFAPIGIFALVCLSIEVFRHFE